MSKKDAKKKSVLREYGEAIIVAVILALLVRTFLVQPFKIPTGSMEPTLLIGDHILVNKFKYGFRVPFLDKRILDFSEPKRGDVVVFRYPLDESKDFIKRVIGIENDVIKIIDKTVYVNGEVYDDGHSTNDDQHTFPKEFQPRDNFGPVVVPHKALFVMGDNRDKSYDSRYWGFVDISKLKGKAFLIYWSWNRDKHWVRLKRLGNIID
ncbi:MAG: signal peptidase I [Thermodesulfobacteriota bacterium]|nr:signal peptidase I [Thermodesulfobacteriota bacterium]